MSPDKMSPPLKPALVPLYSYSSLVLHLPPSVTVHSFLCVISIEQTSYRT